MNKKIEESVKFLNEKNIDIDYSLVNLNDENSFIRDLIKINLNENILRYIIEKFFNVKFVNVNQIEYEFLEKLNFGFIYKDNYIVDFKEFYSSNIFKKISILYKGSLFNNFLLMEKNQKTTLNEGYLISSKEKNSTKKEKIKSDLIEIIDKMIVGEIRELFIDTEKLINEYYYSSFFKKEDTKIFENIKSQVIFECLNELIDKEGFYKINRTQKLSVIKSSENSIILKRSDYYKNNDLMADTQYGSDFLNTIESMSGIFILSQDSDYFYYYDLVDYFENVENKKVFSISDNRKKNSATKKVGYSEKVNSHNISNFDYFMIEDISKINENTFELINYFSSIGKKVIISVYSKDSINSLSSIIYNYSGINKDILSSNIGSIYHVSKVQKLCPNCSKKVMLRDITGIRDKYPELLKRHDKKEYILMRNNGGCESCISGYKSFIPVEQLIKRSVILSEGINNFNVARIKDELSSEANYTSIFEKLEPLVFKEKLISIMDIKDKI